jgi:hypothetical protein
MEAECGRMVPKFHKSKTHLKNRTIVLCSAAKAVKIMEKSDAANFK